MQSLEEMEEAAGGPVEFEFGSQMRATRLVVDELLAGGYVGASLCLWLAAVWLGYLAGTELNRQRSA